MVVKVKTRVSYDTEHGVKSLTNVLISLANKPAERPATQSALVGVKNVITHYGLDSEDVKRAMDKARNEALHRVEQNLNECCNPFL